ncbi:MAG: H-NS histone family protein [Candidatus Accumulibacter sp.]|jgi:DNA-binding protein H-NS|nr:H-NS histone family protein [Accumulibacter sp.]
MDSYQSLLDKISTLQKKASSLRENEKRRAIAEMRKLIELYDVQSAELFSDGKPSVVASKPLPVSATGKRILPPKYRDPATGKTWNGHGKTPLWLVGIGDRSKFLIAAQAEAASDAPKPRKRAQKKAKSFIPPKYRDPETGKTWNGHGKRPFWLTGDKDRFLIGQAEAAGDTLKSKKTQTRIKSLADWQASAAKSIIAKTAKPKKGASSKQVGKRKPRKTASPKTDIAASPTDSKPDALPVA